MPLMKRLLLLLAAACLILPGFASAKMMAEIAEGGRIPES
jgi:UPF0716 family protein affecting phage T7 exclusion